jgi:glycosyltransferase involved in cell wall biosynthesis
MPAAMKIDLIITELSVGGAEQCLTNLAIFLQSQEHEVRVLVLAGEPANDRDRLWKRLIDQGIETTFLGARRLWHLPILLWRLRQQLRRSRPDIAQSFLFHANVVGAVVYPFFRVPLVGAARVADPRRLRRWLNWFAASMMKKLVCVSRSVAQDCCAYDFVPENKICVIANGIVISNHGPLIHGELSPSDFAHKQLGIPPGVPLLLFVGRLDRQKGIDILMERADQLLDELPDYQLVIIGDGPLKIESQQRAACCKNESRIHFTGRRDNVIEWMLSSRLLLLPTRYEGMPNVVLEAMSCGLPVAATRAEGIIELLGDVSDEQTTDIEDWDAWQNNVVRLAASAKLHRQLAQDNFNRCRKEFNLFDKLEQYEAIYEEIVFS